MGEDGVLLRERGWWESHARSMREERLCKVDEAGLGRVVGGNHGV